MSKKNKNFKEDIIDTAEFEATAIDGETIKDVEYVEESSKVEGTHVDDKVETGEVIALTNVWLRSAPIVDNNRIAVIKKDTKMTYIKDKVCNGFIPVVEVEIDEGIKGSGFVMLEFVKEI